MRSGFGAKMGHSWATAIALGAGFFRLVLFLIGFHPLSLPISVLGCSVLNVIGMVYDGLRLATWASNAMQTYCASRASDLL